MCDAILLDEKRLIATAFGNDGIKIWDINNYTLLKEI
jgi:hypothetical protein